MDLAWFPDGGRRGHLGPRLEPSLPALLALRFWGGGGVSNQALRLWPDLGCL